MPGSSRLATLSLLMAAAHLTGCATAPSGPPAGPAGSAAVVDAFADVSAQLHVSPDDVVDPTRIRIYLRLRNGGTHPVFVNPTPMVVGAQVDSKHDVRLDLRMDDGRPLPSRCPPAWPPANTESFVLLEPGEAVDVEVGPRLYECFPVAAPGYYWVRGYYALSSGAALDSWQDQVYWLRTPAVAFRVSR